MNIFSKLLSLILVDPKLMMLGREVTLPLQAVIGTPQQNNDEPEVGNTCRNRNKFINQIRAPGGHIQITIMIDTQQQYIKLNIRGEISIIVVRAHSGRKRDICT
jgi:hypothetical protein